MNWKADKPYNSLPLLPPKYNYETTAILKKCISANKSLAKLQQAGKLLPNQ